MKIHLDMDGVLCDMERAVFELTGKRWDEFPSNSAAWRALKPFDHLYRDLAKMPDSDRLVNGVLALSAKYDIEIGILTAIPLKLTMPFAARDKELWIADHYPELLKNFAIGPHAVDKQKHCIPGDVLIDDSKLNIPQWNAVGGFGILHTSASKSLDELVEYLEERY